MTRDEWDNNSDLVLAWNNVRSMNAFKQALDLVKEEAISESTVVADLTAQALQNARREGEFVVIRKLENLHRPRRRVEALPPQFEPRIKPEIENA